LAEGGRIIIPVGDADNQELQLIEKHAGKFSTRTMEGCRFVPLVGHHAWQKPPQR
jgi:protein-L-isoaspartate(D-aspartate) O-methyltransferase